MPDDDERRDGDLEPPLDDDPTTGEPILGEERDEAWWRWARIVPGRVLTGSPLTRHQRSDVWSGVIAAGLLFLAVFGVIAGLMWLVSHR